MMEAICISRMTPEDSTGESSTGSEDEVMVSTPVPSSESAESPMPSDEAVKIARQEKRKVTAEPDDMVSIY